MTKQANQEIRHKLVKARTMMLISQPFFGVLALRLELKPFDDAMNALFKTRGMPPTMAVDGKNLWYSERFVEETDYPLLRSAVAHEVVHCVLEHVNRRNARNPIKWNVATDFVVNEMLEKSGFQLGPNWLRDKQYDDMTAEHIYTLLPDSSDMQGFCEVMPGAGDNDAANSELSEDWKIATLQSAAAAKAAGKLPASLERFVDQIAAGKVDWRAVLRRFVTERSKNDYSWLRPNRHFLAAGLYLPTLYSESMGELAVVIDTSGSIDQPTLDAFAAEICAIRDSTKPKRTYVIYCDAAVNHVDTFEQDDMLQVKPHGGGGTDFRPPFEWLAKRSITPVALIYLTDMYGAFPEAAPFPTLWCATTDVKGPFGETVRIEL